VAEIDVDSEPEPTEGPASVAIGSDRPGPATPAAIEAVTPAARPSRTALLVAYATLYVVWGSTYLAIAIGVRTWTPLMLAATRFLIAGAGLYAVLRARGVPPPGRRAWGAATIAGGLMLCGGNGTVCWAEQWVPSGETALILSCAPLWMVLLPWLLRRAPAPRPAVIAGILVGLAGVVVLIVGRHAGGEGAALGGRPLLIGRLSLLVASLSWVVGSLLSRGLPLPKSTALATAMEMVVASPILFAAAVVHGDWAHFRLAAVSAPGWLALAYLIVFGSLAGFGSYVYLLVHEGPARSSTNAFVNPLIAVALGALLAGEPVGARTFLAAGMIVAAVAGVIWGTSRA
jgi:drug/metabolite transporter (DMT)-like permease